MTSKQFSMLVDEAKRYSLSDSYITAMIALPDLDIPSEQKYYVFHNIWHIVNDGFSFIKQTANHTLNWFSEHFIIPRRTVESWTAPGANHRDAPLYMLLMMAQLLGMLPPVE